MRRVVRRERESVNPLCAHSGWVAIPGAGTIGVGVDVLRRGGDAVDAAEALRCAPVLEP